MFQSAPIRAGDAGGLAASELAIVEMPWLAAWVTSIWKDDTFVYQSRDDTTSSVLLTPGIYLVSYKYACHLMPDVSNEANVKLEAGHRYRADYRCCQSWTPESGCSLWSYRPSGRQVTFLWFEDLTTGQVVDGSKTEPAD
jgi:hypothetical protein